MDKSFGFVRLDACMADDESVVNAARVSFARQSEIHGGMTGKDKGLINFLMRERHGTPFEHNAFRFHIKCPIFVAREWFRHRIGSFNEFSARYSEVGDEFWVPEYSAIRTQTGKPGEYKYEPVAENIAELSCSLIGDANQFAYAAYKRMLEMGVAKEIARSVLPVSMYTQFYWTVNARSLMNFLSLRLHESAQREIREYAAEVEKLFAEKMPVTYDSWVANGRQAP